MLASPRELEIGESPREPVMFMKKQRVNEELKRSRWQHQKIKLLKARRLMNSLVGKNGEKIEGSKMKGLPDIFIKTREIQNWLGLNSPLIRDV
jgi:hypothetical protein